MRRYVDVARTMAQDDDQALLLGMLLDDAYQKAVHTPPPLPSGHRPEAAPKDQERGRGADRQPDRQSDRQGEPRQGGEGQRRRRRKR
jgi:ATP-dependent RNA helicase DeaD